LALTGRLENQAANQKAVVVSADKPKVPLHEMDRMILSSFSKLIWRKTLYILTRVEQECVGRGITISLDEIFERIAQLVDSGTLEAEGDISLWRYSELGPVLDD
jgi:hypothetical protein